MGYLQEAVEGTYHAKHLGEGDTQMKHKNGPGKGQKCFFLGSWDNEKKV